MNTLEGENWKENDGTWIDWENIHAPKWVENWDEINEEELITLIENLTDEKLMEEGGE